MSNNGNYNGGPLRAGPIIEYTRFAEEGSILTWNVSGKLSDRDKFANERPEFSFLALDANPIQIFIKRSLAGVYPIVWDGGPRIPDFSVSEFLAAEEAAGLSAEAAKISEDNAKADRDFIQSSITTGVFKGETGVGVTNAIVNGAGRLILTYSNGSTVDAGYVVGPPQAPYSLPFAASNILGGVKANSGPSGRNVVGIGSDGLLTYSSREAASLRNVLENASFSYSPRGASAAIPSAGGSGRLMPPWYAALGLGGIGSLEQFAVNPSTINTAMRAIIGNPKSGKRIRWTTPPTATTNQDPVYGPKLGTNRFTFLEHFGVRNPLWQNGDKASYRIYARLTTQSGYASSGVSIAGVIRVSDTTSTRTIADPGVNPPALHGDGYQLVPSYNSVALTTSWAPVSDTLTIPYRTSVDLAQNTQLAYDLVTWPTGTPFGIEVICAQMEAGSTVGDFVDAGESLEAYRCQSFFKGFGKGLVAHCVQPGGPSVLRICYTMPTPGEFNNIITPLLLSTYMALDWVNYNYTATDMNILTSSVGECGGTVDMTGNFTDVSGTAGLVFDRRYIIKATGNTQGHAFGFQFV